VLERKLPTLVRHALFFCRVFVALLPGFFLGLKKVDFIFILDTFSVGWPAVAAAKLTGTKSIIRTGGDFLWESYVERTGDLVLLKNFYGKIQKNPAVLNFKERMIFSITKWTLHNASAVVFSTDWQRHIFEDAYFLDRRNSFIVENFYGEKLPAFPDTDAKENKKHVFVAGTRSLKWKNIERLKRAFADAQHSRLFDSSKVTIELDTAGAPYEEFLNKIRSAYAVILVSLGDISPNMILDALRANTPFILTRENGLQNRLADVGIFVDPENVADIKEKILFLADSANHTIAQEKIKSFTFTHSWKEICDEIATVAQKIGVTF
jgi:glycosyltransferase involved in cell wall biosynthesis